MTSPDSSFINVVFGIVLLMSVMYATGRLHQWLRQGAERDNAFREGYDKATESLFTVATRTSRRLQSIEAPASVTEITDAPSARHRAEDQLSRTQRLPFGQWSA